MKKPKKIKKNPVYDYDEINDYIEKKYKISTRDYAGHFTDNSKPYQDFWHWLIEATQIHNDQDNWIPLEYLRDKKTPKWVKEILQMFKDEFGEEGSDEIQVHHSW